MVYLKRFQNNLHKDDYQGQENLLLVLLNICCFLRIFAICLQSIPVSPKLYKISSLLNHSEAISVEVVFPATLYLIRSDFSFPGITLFIPTITVGPPHYSYSTFKYHVFIKFVTMNCNTCPLSRTSIKENLLPMYSLSQKFYAHWKNSQNYIQSFIILICIHMKRII